MHKGIWKLLRFDRCVCLYLINNNTNNTVYIERVYTYTSQYTFTQFVHDKYTYIYRYLS